MPVHEIRYKPWEGELRPPLMRLLAVPKFTLMGVWNKMLAVSLFAGGLLPILCYTGYVLVASNPVIRELLDIRDVIDFGTPVLMERLLWMQTFFSTMLALVAAPRMISTELANRALPLVYSRPLSRPAYIGGKFAGLFALLAPLTWLQTLAIWFIMAILYPESHPFHQEFLKTSVPCLFSTLLLGVLLSATLSAVALACSAATKSPRFGAVLFFILMAAGSFFTNFIQNSGWRGFPNVGVREIFYWLGTIWIGTDPAPRFGTFGLLVALSLWIGGAVGFMLWKLRPVDVYGD